MVVRSWHKIVGTMFGVILALGVIGDRVATVSINEMYSPDWHSSSVDEARANGVLVSRPVVEPLTVDWGGVPLTVRDAWVEEGSRWSYRFYLFRRVIKDGRYRLIVRMARIPAGQAHAASALGGAEWLAYDDSLRFDTWASGEYWMRVVRPPFPDTVRLVVHHR
jgi:hypothetical protein